MRLTPVPGPFPLAVADAMFDDAVLARLTALFEGWAGWPRHEDTFYRCWITEVHDELDPAWLAGLRHEVSEALGVPLAGPVRVTAQRMAPGDGSDRHTDRPLAGYEAARLVLQLDSAEGGHFRTFDGERLWLERPPRPNQAVAFELSARSWHAVTPCASVRRTVVFHFWHPDNPPDMRERLDAMLAGVSFAELPRALHRWMDEAEARLPDELTNRAGLVAALLGRQGHEDDVLVEAYRAVVDGRPLEGAAARAGWLVGLHLEGLP